MGVAKAIPSAVVPSTANTVKVNTKAQLGPYKPMSGSARGSKVPRSDDLTDKNITPQPAYSHGASTGSPRGSGNAGAPSVPHVGLIFQAPPIDAHYMTETEDSNPYHKVNNPPTRGRFAWIKDYLNHIAYSQNTDTTGMKQSGPQQRTSHMRTAMPPHGVGYAPETYDPKQLPQADNTYKFMPSTGTDPYGSGVLNSDTFGAGQTAGGIGGNNYTPTPGPPATNSTAGNSGAATGMPVWG